jgi:hypothetical protein
VSGNLGKFSGVEYGAGRLRGLHHLVQPSRAPKLDIGVDEHEIVDIASRATVVEPIGMTAPPAVPDLHAIADSSLSIWIVPSRAAVATE